MQQALTLLAEAQTAERAGKHQYQQLLGLGLNSNIVIPNHPCAAGPDPLSVGRDGGRGRKTYVSTVHGSRAIPQYHFSKQPCLVRQALTLRAEAQTGGRGKKTSVTMVT